MPTENRSLLMAALHDERVAPDLRRLARRIVWWESPSGALDDGDAFVAAVMNEGTSDEIELVESIVGEQGLTTAYTTAPSGSFDPVRRRIWAMRLLGTPPANVTDAG